MTEFDDSSHFTGDGAEICQIANDLIPNEKRNEPKRKGKGEGKAKERKGKGEGKGKGKERKTKKRKAKGTSTKSTYITEFKRHLQIQQTTELNDSSSLIKNNFKRK